MGPFHSNQTEPGAKHPSARARPLIHLGSVVRVTRWLLRTFQLNAVQKGEGGEKVRGWARKVHSADAYCFCFPLLCASTHTNTHAKERARVRSRDLQPL